MHLVGRKRLHSQRSRAFLDNRLAETGEMDREEVSSEATREPHFFKIITPHDLENKTLEIPPKFVEKYGKCLKRHVFLQVPEGARTKVHLKKSDGRVWLHKGWQGLVEHYSVKCWYFLVFRYEGKSFFHVIIFNPSCSEIEYPVSDDDDSDDDSVEILDECPQTIQRSRKVPMANQSSRGRCVTSAQVRVVQRANAFKSQNPRFVVQMRPSYISNGYMHIPDTPVRSYFCGRDDKGICLRGPDGRDWNMEYYHAVGRGVGQLRFGSGWKQFVREYDLHDGDACLFELLNSRAMSFNVTIFRVKDEES